MTRNAAKMLEFEEGDTVTLQNLDLTEVEAPITLIFALIVNVITNRTLDKINMVEALKSVE